MKNKIKTAVVGATGYAGAELVRLLLTHPAVQLTGISSVSFEGREIDEVYLNFKKLGLPTLTDEDTAIAGADVVFAALPHGLSEILAGKCAVSGALLIDLGADFRLADENEYSEWYKKPFDKPELHSGAVYALPELFRDEIKSAKIIANPGCYPTAAGLALYPALKLGLIEKSGIIIDAKSGVTGAGRSLTQNTHYPETNESISAYKVGAHRHTPEIEQTVSRAAGEHVNVVFVPHLLPVNRGIEETIYCRLSTDMTEDEIRAAYVDFYKEEPFVRIEAKGVSAQIRNVARSNYCDISIHTDKRTGTLILCSCIDNMVKGAAGQAIQNMNLYFGLDEGTGIDMVPAPF